MGEGSGERSNVRPGMGILTGRGGVERRLPDRAVGPYNPLTGDMVFASFIVDEGQATADLAAPQHAHPERRCVGAKAGPREFPVNFKEPFDE